MMRASDVEFRARFWFIGGIFWLGFLCYAFDHQTAGVAVAQLLWRRSIDPSSMSPARPLHVVFAFAAFLCILCGLIRTWAAAYLRSTVVHDHALHSESLVADGPFRYVRNPLYLGGVFLAAGCGFLASRTGWFVMTFGLIFFYYRLIFREEAALNASQGQSFRNYCGAVPRFFPALRPRVPSSGAKPRWGQAFAGEMFIWGFTVGVVVFAITLNEALCWTITTASFVGYLVYWLISARLAKSKLKPPATT
ncbi:MAG TPA: isoprenylcysteine carboxylmethyltransferase family protein [Candidatus Acidoferrales bacterium]|nr:isoprenylcysteine carboxylmethyltransferase family protein [Candidatus Acidoferrales bacterium]